MASIITPTPWTQQPQYPCEIDWGNQVTRGLASCVIGGRRFDVVNGLPITLNGGIASGVTSAGVGFTNNASGTSYINTPTITGSTAFSVLGVVITNTTTGIQSVCDADDAIDPLDRDFQLRFNGSNAEFIRFDTAPAAYTATATGAVSAGKRITLVGVSDGTGVTVYANGVTGSATITGTPSALSCPPEWLCRSVNHGTGNSGFNGSLLLGGIFNRALSPAEVKSLSDNPWQIFRPINRRIYVDIPASSGSPYSLAVDGTSYSLTYSNPTLAASRKLGLDATSLSITPSTLGLKAARKLGVDATSLTLSFSATQLVAAKKLGVSATGYALTFEDPSLTYVPSSGDYQFGVDGTTYSITYADPVFKRTLVTNVDATSLALTFSDPSFAQGFSATVGRPVADDVTGSWHPSTGSDLYAMLDETSADDADYIYANSATTCEVGLNGVADPGTSSGQVLSYRAWSPTGNGLVVTLKQGATTIATWTHATLPLTATTYTQSLSAAECDAITDYTALSVEMTSL